MGTIREMLAKPAVGWTIAGIAVLVAVFLFWRSSRSGSYDLNRLSEKVTVRFTDTDDEITLLRAEFEKQLRSTPGQLSVDSGIINPKTGKPTGILVATEDWKEVVHRINGERDWAKQNSPFGPSANAQPVPTGSSKSK